MIDSWDPAGPGVLRLPSGRLVRGRGLLRAYPMGPPPTFGVYLLGKPASLVAWESRWVRWPDLWLPSDPADAGPPCRRRGNARPPSGSNLPAAAAAGAPGRHWPASRSSTACPPPRRSSYVREHYDRRAVETPWQKRFVARFAPRPPDLN